MDLRWKFRLAAISTACVCSGAAHAQVAPATAPTPVAPAKAAADDMAMPDDLGAPLAGPKAARPTSAPTPLSVNSPIDRIAANPGGKAALERSLPGLCERPEYPMFKTLSLSRLASMSNGRITEATLVSVQADLTHVDSARVVSAPSHGVFYPIAHTAGDSVRYGGREIKQISNSIYHRVALVIASL